MMDGLSARAREAERLRMNLDMRTSAADSSQRMLNALEPGTVLPIHRHRSTTETCIVLRGAMIEIFYDDLGRETARHELRAGSDCVGLSVPAGQWHKAVCLEPGTVIFEAKDGAYEPTTPADILNL